ncbi:MAG: MmcQ/YjbR family DNA-binding protein [Betaproteobacteria bacterium]|jgi:predicted DNA-binding protein (MmcQ/YjbR family)|nr:MmcQ/YjbR family DNA-binding protein [Betaproteobacteria bacterium]MBK9683625.1 MmcQ/YjbR family DNA-binding protein [Betaproteobacteria bacterium]MBP6317281.1 MmcQ/YjbR family DNA-binding protein [Rubrivivax sp.]
MARPRPAPDFEPQRALAAALPGATEDIKWGADLVYSVGGKMFCVFLLEAGRAATCSFKVDDERFLELTGVPGVIPAPYLARAKWVQVGRVHGLAGADLDALVRSSHALVASRLTKKLQRDIGISTGETTRPCRPAAEPGPHGERTVKA